MTWGWAARGELPVDANATATTGGGGRGGVTEAAKTQAWPRYEADYLKRALQSERLKYATDGLDEEQKVVYLDKVTSRYQEEADEVLKTEFEQWLQGQHAANDPEGEQVYENVEGKPVRRWVTRSAESEDTNGNSKVGQARAGWKHTPWGRASLTGLPGVRDYLRTQKERANETDLRMQLLAEYGPQNIGEAWKYFKHWVKGRPLSDAVAIPSTFEHMAPGARADLGNQQPDRMYDYDPEPHDRQPQVYATDRNAYNAAVAAPGERAPTTTTEWEDRNVHEARQFRDVLEAAVRGGAADLAEGQAGDDEIAERAKSAEARDVLAERVEDAIDLDEKRTQGARLQELTAPGLDVLR